MEIVVRFLCDRYVARRSDAPERSEWPPSPDRLFQALTNGACRLEDVSTRAAARKWLEWLAEQDPPNILAAAAQEADASLYRYDVRNVTTKKGGTRKPQVNPRQDIVGVVDTPLADDTIVFRYHAEPPADLAAAAAATASLVGYLGTSESPVVMTLGHAEPHAEHVEYFPNSQGRHVLGVPYRGRLAHLDASFEEASGRDHPVWAPVPRATRVGALQYPGRGETPCRPCGWRLRVDASTRVHLARWSPAHHRFLGLSRLRRRRARCVSLRIHPERTANSPATSTASRQPHRGREPTLHSCRSSTLASRMPALAYAALRSSCPRISSQTSRKRRSLPSTSTTSWFAGSGTTSNTDPPWIRNFRHCGSAATRERRRHGRR